MLKIDFGSGYNPAKEYKLADITGMPYLDYLIQNTKLYSKTGNEIKENSVDEFRLRNVIHHIKDLDILFANLFKYLKPNGIVEIIDCNKKHYFSNYCLDNVWYRYIIPRKEIYIADVYRNYIAIAIKNGFVVLNKNTKNEKDIVILQKTIS